MHGAVRSGKDGRGGTRVADGVTGGTGGRRPDGLRLRGAAPLLGLALAVGLALAALCLHATSAVPVFGEGPLAHEWLLFAIFAFVAGIPTVMTYRSRQDERPRMTAREDRITAVVVFGTLALIGATVISLAVIGSGLPSKPEQPPTPPQPVASRPPGIPVPNNGVPQGNNHAPNTMELLPILRILLIVFLAGILIMGVFLFARRFRILNRSVLVASSAPAAAETDDVRLAEAVSAGRTALQGDDTRAAVIACYAAMETSLTANGVGRHASDSPSDLLARAAGAGLLTGPAPEALADLFREARYSTHPMGRDQLERARGALDAIGALLAGRRAEAEEQAAAWSAEVDRPDAPADAPVDASAGAGQRTVTR